MTQVPDPRVTAPTLTLTRRGTDRDPVVAVAGEIDVATSPSLRDELAAILEHTPDSITVDLAQVTFIDSSGLGVLVGALKRVRQHKPTGGLRILHAQDSVRKVFDITGLDGLFDLQS